MAGGVTQADQAALEAETDEDTYVPPDLIKHSPGVAKAWVKWEQAGAHSIIASYGMTSVTDGGAAGDTDHLWATNFSSEEYVIAAMSFDNYVPYPVPGSQAVGGVTTVTSHINGTVSDRNADPQGGNTMAVFGDQ